MLLKCCHLLWKCRILLKIKLFGWLLLRQRLMTHRWSVLCAPEQPKIAPIYSSNVTSHRWHGGQHLRAVWLHLQPTLYGDLSAGGHFDMQRNDNLSSPLCGPFGFTGTTLSSEVIPLEPMQFSTTLGGSLISGTEAV